MSRGYPAQAEKQTFGSITAKKRVQVCQEGYSVPQKRWYLIKALIETALKPVFVYVLRLSTIKAFFVHSSATKLEVVEYGEGFSKVGTCGHEDVWVGAHSCNESLQGAWVHCDVVVQTQHPLMARLGLLHLGK